MSDLTGWKVHGPVQMLRREHAEWDAALETWKAARGITVARFRADGQIMDSEFHNPDGSVARWGRVYDDAGRLIEAQWWNDEGPRSRVIYSYDSVGRPTHAVEVAGDGTSRQVETCQYDAGGRRTKVSVLANQRTHAGMSVMYQIEGTEQGYAAPGAVTSTTAYDERDLPAEVSFHDASRALVLRIVLSRDGEGRLLTEDVYYGGETPFPTLPADLAGMSAADRAAIASTLATVFANKTFSQTTYAYDAKGRLVERVRRFGSLSEDRTTFRYDDHDNSLEEVSEHHGRALNSDEHGVVRTTEEASQRQEYRFHYEYDAHGNWTERVVSIRTPAHEEFRRSNVERRMITYY